ncbi:MAG TPA: N-6 DNA methylase [Thermoanaerobaculia bacterium]|nr:N-6 DNA methylase [Thermoanaerobaculia bacterium]
MIAAARLRDCRSIETLFALLADLGYPVRPIAIVATEWRKAGFDLPFEEGLPLHLACRTPFVDVYTASGAAPIDSAAALRFLRSLQVWNTIAKPVLFALDEIAARIAVYDLSARRELRRLDVDLENPTAHSLDRLNLLAAGATVVDLPRIVDRALDRESLTRSFFERFRDSVRAVALELGQCCTAESRESIDAEALLLLSRILFLYFIQEKGWLNNERRFLVDRLDGAVRNGSSFFATILMPLFFGCLNTAEQDRDEAGRALGSIPYLNGGLFEPSPFELRNAALSLPNHLFRRVLEEVFEKFDFNIDERDAAGTHVDPEMLGKVFESLMAADVRTASGSFYTPKPIVDVLTTRAVVTWCAGDDATLREDLTALAGGRDRPIATELARSVLVRLERVTVLDPACGSGAFLLSALSVIERLSRSLADHAGIAPPDDLRQAIVERSLFGVDLKPEAVRLCELRLWLAIVSDQASRGGNVQPLPNLDRNILQGNSLLSPTDFLGAGRLDLYREWVYALRAHGELIRRYRCAPQKERPALARQIRSNDLKLATDLLTRSLESDERELRASAMPVQDLFGRMQLADVARPDELTTRIHESRRALERIQKGELDFFSFDVHFAHVLAGGGFDIVVGNPPWIRNSRIEPQARRMFSDRYRLFRGDGARGAGSAFHQPDVSVAFFERALSLTTADAVLSMLLPSKILNAGYAAPLRRMAASQLSVVALDDWSDDAAGPRWFEADTFPLGFTVTKGTRSEGCVAVSAGGKSFAIEQDSLAAGCSRNEWSILPPEVGKVLARVRERFAPLEDVLGRRPIMGIKTGDNRSFFLDGGRIAKGLLTTVEGIGIPLEAVCRCVRGRDVRRWRVTDSHWMLWPPVDGWRTPLPWLEQLAMIRGVTTASLRLEFVRPEHAGIKVAWKDLSRGVCAVVLPDSVHVDRHAFTLVPNQTLYLLDATSLDEAYGIAALLNSTVAGALALCTAERAKDFHFRYFGRTVGGVPIPEIDRSGSEWERLVRLARRAHQGSETGGEIDYLVASLYGITTEELERLRLWVARRLGLERP